jgi:hypothetical protein
MYAMQTVFIIISSALALISPILYVTAILKGKAKPHRTTRLVLLFINALATVSLFAQHNNVAIYLAAVSTIQGIVIFALSIKYGMGGWTKLDVSCLIIAAMGIVLWQVTHQPVLALYASIMADFTGSVPTLIKTFRYPDTEVWTFYFLDTFAAGFNLLALHVWTVQQFAYPLYLVFINLSIVILVIRPKLSLSVHKVINVPHK